MRDLGGSGRTSAYSDRSADAPVRFLFRFNGIIFNEKISCSFLEQEDFFWPSI